MTEKIEHRHIGRPLGENGSPLGWALLRTRLWGAPEAPALETVLAEWRTSARAVIEGEKL